MNSLLNSKALCTSFPRIKDDIANIDLSKYRINEKYIHDLKIRLNNIRQPLSDIVLNYYKSKDFKVVPVLFQDPITKGIGRCKEIPPVIMNYMKPNKEKGVVENIIDLSLKGGYRRNGDGSIDKLNLELNDYYAFYQLAVVRDLLQQKGEAIVRHFEFLDSLSMCYALLLSNVISIKYSIGGGFKIEDRSILTLLCQLFFYESHVGIPKDKAIQMCMKNIYYRDYKTLIESNCKYLTVSAFNMNDFGKDNSFIIDCFIEVLREQFDSCDNLSYRALLFEFTRVYNTNSSLCLESFWSFLNMIQLIDLKINIVNIMTKDYIKKHIKDVIVALKSILS